MMPLLKYRKIVSLFIMFFSTSAILLFWMVLKPPEVNASLLLDENFCFTEYTGDNITDFASVDESALQNAVDNAPSGSIIKVAGICAGAHSQGGQLQTVYISKTITIQGGYTTTNWLASPNFYSHPTTLNAQNSGRVVFIASSGAGYDIELSNLIITGGNTVGNGGGVYNQGSTFTISSTQITNNIAGQNGGGIYQNTWLLNLNNSLVSDNIATSAGGGIYNNTNGILYVSSTSISSNEGAYGGGIGSYFGNTHLSNSIVDNNTAVSGGGIYNNDFRLDMINSIVSNNTGNYGGGIYNSEGIIDLLNSNISNNHSGLGGGIHNLGGSVNLINSTISENTATDGGGVTLYQDTIVSIFFSTIVSNTASNGNDGLWLANGTLTITNSIVAHNGSANCFGNGNSLSSGGYNISSDDTCPLSNIGDLTNTDPLVLPLGNYGGNTLTHAILPGSPAYERIPPGINGCGTFIINDQRGVIRPQETNCEIGAYEYMIPILDIQIYLPVILR